MKLSLLVLTTGKQEGKVLEIKLPQFLIGRDPQCQLRPASPLISKRHCAIIQKDGKAYIRDFDSTNGTFVNDEQIEGECEIHNDDFLKIGPIQFKVRIEDGAATPTPTPVTRPTNATPLPPTKGTTTAPTGPVNASTPVPSTLTTAPTGGGEDDIAAMLMELEDGERSAGIDSVPEGSTVFDMKVPPEEGGQPKPAEDPKKKSVMGSGDTRSAAARILEKMTKRPRS